MDPAPAASNRLARTLPGRFYPGETARARGDWHVCEWVQPGVRSPALQAAGVCVPIERKIRGFKDYVLEQLGPTEGAAGSEG